MPCSMRNEPYELGKQLPEASDVESRVRRRHELLVYLQHVFRGVGAANYKAPGV